MAAGNSTRLSAGVVCYLQEGPNGHLRLVLDDVASESESQAGPWKRRALFTSKDFEAQAIDSMHISAVELAALGESVLARLVAYRKHDA